MRPDALAAGIASCSYHFYTAFARHLKAGREVVRGKPETFNRPDYNFRSSAMTAREP
jgi:exoribonuclease-2